MIDKDIQREHVIDSTSNMSMECDTYFKSIKIDSFSGKQSDWQKWSLKLLANASVRGYKGILLGKEEVPMDSARIDTTTNEGEKQWKLCEKNKEAYNELVLRCNDEVSLGAIEAATSTYYAEGDTKQAWNNL